MGSTLAAAAAVPKPPRMHVPNPSKRNVPNEAAHVRLHRDLSRRARPAAAAPDATSRAARAAFRWPALDRFNWALDHFDALAARQRARRPCASSAPATPTARIIVRRPRRPARTRSPTGCAALGVRRGDRILLLLGNVPPLWEAMLAAMKLGAVVIPATTMLTDGRPARPVQPRPACSHVIADGELAARFAAIAGDYTRIAVGGAPGWTDFAEFDAASRTPSRPTARRGRPIRCCCISRPAPPPSRSSCCTAIRATRSATCRRCTGSGCSPATCTSTSPRRAGPSTPGRSVFAPWNAGATILILNQPRFDARDLLARAGPRAG